MPPAFSYAFYCAFSHYFNVFRATRCTRLVIVPSHRSSTLHAKPVFVSVLSTHTRLFYYVADTRAASNAVFLVERISTRDAKVVFLSLLD